jgi:hypothetical protein
MQGRFYDQLPFLWIVPDVHYCCQTLDVLTITDFTLCLEEMLKIFLLESNAVTFTMLSGRLYWCSLEDNSSALFLDSSRSLLRSEISFCVILCGSPEVTFGKNSGSLDVGACCILLGVFSFSSSQCI